MNIPLILGEPSRCVIYCSIATFNTYSEDWQRSFLRPVVEAAGGDYPSVSILGIIKGKKVFIVFDYKNPEHLSTCKVLGFRVKRAPSFKLITVPADYVHSTVGRWLEENKRWGISFPREYGKTRASSRALPRIPPRSAGEPAKHNTPQSEQGSFVSTSIYLREKRRRE
ncbi:hypothetical protein K469DRAFT_1862 [Zopfia rhizophila CBS 207.26]|uniref:Uncharacterized protein n=1 Tax=Zopfia rhizophila CBS 207.26 TaxID=1314779 RepID=A0A6A6EUN6_9PEZI|nr:hypothetical protein K469DRAFT_1862 [Zopfia rhizophila CBS 207.26]